MRVGIIGCGGMGTTHYLSLKALSEQMDLEVTALADVRKEFLEKAAAHFPDAHTYDTGMELLEKEQLDVVHICLPSYLHTEHAVVAMEKGMHVFIEKPVCLTREDADLLLQKEKETGVKVMVGQVVRCFAEYEFLKKAYEAGTYGKLESIVMKRISGDVQWGHEDWFHDENRSGSVVLDLHVHDLDFLRYMLGEPDSFDVKATAFDSGMVNQIVTTYEFGNVFACVEGSWNVCPKLPFRAAFRANFEDAVVWYDGSSNPSLTVYKKDGMIEVPELHKEYDISDSSAGINISNLGPYYSEIKYFAECILNNREIDIAPLAEGVNSVELAIREWDAAKKYVSAHN